MAVPSRSRGPLATPERGPRPTRPAYPTRLHVEYNNGSYVEAVFDGRGADANCFEGITRFYDDPNPNDAIPPVLSPYSAAYRICN